jgi:hypothetical protein
VWAGLFLLLTTAILYGPALHGFFAADDFLWLRHHDWHDARTAFTGNWGLGTAYRPLTRLSFVVDARSFGWNDFPWHAENLALHALNAWLVWCLAAKLAFTRWEAWAVALLFLAMPVQWENVDWISGRTGSLCLFFMLLAVLSWQRAVRTSLWLMLPAAAAQLAALLCYEPAFVLPIVLPLLVPRDRLRARRAIQGVAIMAGTTAAFWALRAIALGSAALAVDVAGADPPLQLWRNAEAVTAHLWRDLGWVAALTAIGLVATGLLDARSRTGMLRAIGAALLLYAPFALVSGFTERFFYLASVPTAFALVIGARARPALRLALAMLLVMFGLRTHAQATAFAAAGALSRALLNQIAALPRDGSNLVFESVPAHAGPYYMVTGGFRDAVSMRRPGPHIVATSEMVLNDPAALRVVLAGPTRFMVYDEAAKQLIDLPRDTWLARHPGVRP